MKISDLTAYAEEKYHMQEIFRWPDQPGLSVLQEKGSKEYAALLIRRWDPETGDTREYADMRLKEPYVSPNPPAWISSPYRMHGKRWAGISFTEEADEGAIFRLFDEAVVSSRPQGYTVVLNNITVDDQQVYHDTALPERTEILKNRPDIKAGIDIDIRKKTSSVTGHFFSLEEDPVPEMIQKLTQLFTYNDFSFHEKCKNFYLQAMFMKDYEDDAPWSGECRRFLTVYQDLTVRQLRGYFTWRTKLKHGIIEKVSTPLACIYLYELLNGIGADSPEDCIVKMREFEQGFLDAGYGDVRLRENLHRWMTEFCILHGLPQETALSCMDPELKENDEALSVLKDAETYSDHMVYTALQALSHVKLSSSSAVKKYPQESEHLFAAVWRFAADEYTEKNKNLLTLCFGELQRVPWHPLSSAVWFRREDPEPFDYELTSCRRYLYQDGLYATVSYQSFLADKTRLDTLLHAADRKIRLYLKSGNPLREREDERWAEPLIDAVLARDKAEKEEAARPKISIDFSGLSQIRKDAVLTRDSLLTEENTEEFPFSLTKDTVPPEEETVSSFMTAERDLPETEEIELSDAMVYKELYSDSQDMASAFPEQKTSSAASSECPIDLSPALFQVLKLVLEGASPQKILNENRLTASLAADAINEAFFDEIGDTIIDCDNDTLFLIEDYREEIKALLNMA